MKRIKSIIFCNFYIVVAALLFTACSDFGERDNPLDPGASNYEAVIEKPESSSSTIY